MGGMHTINIQINKVRLLKCLGQVNSLGSNSFSLLPSERKCLPEISARRHIVGLLGVDGGVEQKIHNLQVIALPR